MRDNKCVNVLLPIPGTPHPDLVETEAPSTFAGEGAGAFLTPARRRLD